MTPSVLKSLTSYLATTISFLVDQSHVTVDLALL